MGLHAFQGILRSPQKAPLCSSRSSADLRECLSRRYGRFESGAEISHLVILGIEYDRAFMIRLSARGQSRCFQMDRHGGHLRPSGRTEAIGDCREAQYEIAEHRRMGVSTASQGR
jgi:hypothetical protein